MKIQEHVVKMLNEDSWDDVVRYYLEASSIETLKDFYIALNKGC